MSKDRQAVDDDFAIVVGAGVIVFVLGLIWAAAF